MNFIFYSFYRHFIALGVGKLLLLLTFKKGTRDTYKTSKGPNQTVTRTAQCKKIEPSKLNDELRQVRVPYEFSRNTRDLDHTVYKAEEYRNFVLFMFPLCWKVMPQDQDVNKRMFSMLGFLIRAYTLPDEEYQCIELATLIFVQGKFVSLMKTQHGEWNCTYNVHLGNHILIYLSIGKHMYK